MYERLPSLSIVAVHSVCRQRCLLYFAALSCSSSLKRQCNTPWGAGIRTPLGTRAASAELNLPSFSILSAQCCLSAILPHSDRASRERRLFSGACRQCTPLPTQLTARETQSQLFITLTSLSRFTRGIPQHIVRLGQLSALPDPTPSLASSCFPWPLSVAAYRLPKSPCRMRHIEQTRRVAVENPIRDLSLAANPRTGSTRAFCRAYSLHATDFILIPSATPRVDSSATHPTRDQPCSTSSH
jgi:hypothetical protein